MSTLDRIKSLGFSGRHGHPCLYDVISEAVKLSKPLSFLEIGVYDGASLFTVLTESSANRIVLCDIFNREYQASEGWRDQQPGSAQHIRDMLSMLKYSGEASFLIEDSRTAIPRLKDSFDLIHIDGNHETEYVRADFRNCFPLLKSSGYMVMDDSVWPTVSIVCDEMVKDFGMRHILTLRDSESGSSIYQNPTA